MTHCKQNFLCESVWMCRFEYVCMHICTYVRIIPKICDIRYHQLIFKQTVVNDLWLHNHQQCINIYIYTHIYTYIYIYIYILFTVVSGGNWSVLLGSQSINDCIEIPKTVALVINWWTLSLESLYLIGLLIFSFKKLHQIFQIVL